MKFGISNLELIVTGLTSVNENKLIIVLDLESIRKNNTLPNELNVFYIFRRKIFKL
jgi:hypothetical protein